MSYTVAIVGRPNVGKSTLFNRFIEERRAIVDDRSGVTRDRQYGISDWNGKTFNVVDTGGFVSESEDMFEKEINSQVKLAIEESDIIIFMVDVTCGITQLDQEMADLLHRAEKPILLTVNKVDNANRQVDAMEFYSLGFDPIYNLSSISGSGTGELLDDLVKYIKDDPKMLNADLPEGLPKLAIIGQPNVGKSSLLNALVGAPRTIVSPVAGTTRDPIHTRYNLFQKDFILIDTAGIRRKDRERDDLEFYSVIRAIRVMDECDVCLLMLDAEKGITAQDLNIFSLAYRKGKGIVLIVNKWDLIEDKTANSTKGYSEMLQEKIAPFTDVPILFISALEKQRIFKVIETALSVFANRSTRIPTSKLNDVILKSVEAYHAPVVRGHSVKIKFVTQLPTPVPSFAFFTNLPEDIKKPYRNYLENQLRKNFNLSGIPVRIYFRKK